MGREKLHLPPPFEEVMRRYEREIMRFLVRVAGDREDAADLFQETWLRAYRAYPRLDPDSDARPWLYAIATNLWRNRARDGARRARVIVPQPPEHLPPQAGASINHRPHDSEAYAAIHLREQIAALPIKQRQALYLRYFAGLDYGQIGTAMQCSAQAARANVSQAARKLKAGRAHQ
jgi:RNA polymerase sigma factor (sigma-70 family)